MKYRVTSAGPVEFTLKHYDEFANNLESSRRAYETLTRLMSAKRVVLWTPEKPRLDPALIDAARRKELR